MKTLTLPESKLVKNQKKIYGWKEYQEDGDTYRIKAVVRHDDECGNGHNTFSITGTIERKNGRGIWQDHGGGCIHEEIAKHFPELTPYIKWHLMGTDQPMHYIANTLYLAGIKDCYGKTKGEPYHFQKSIKFLTCPVVFTFDKKFIEWIEDYKGPYNYMAVSHRDEEKEGTYQYAPKYTFYGFICEWHEAPFDDINEAQQFAEAFNSLAFEVIGKPTSWGEGKEPELEAARRTAIWPDATLEQLQSKEALEARLPALMQEFKKDVESLGLIY